MSKRSKTKYPNLTRNLNLKRRQELIDFDYIDKLSEEEKEFLNQFMGEYMGASFKKENITESKGKERSYKRFSNKNLHKKAQTKEIYDLNNARNRDVYAKKTCTGGMEFFDEVTLDDLREKNLNEDMNNFEDAMILKDLYASDFELYKIATKEYLNSIKNVKERQEEIKYLVSKGYTWVLED